MFSAIRAVRNKEIQEVPSGQCLTAEWLGRHLCRSGFLTPAAKRVCRLDSPFAALSLQNGGQHFLQNFEKALSSFTILLNPDKQGKRQLLEKDAESPAKREDSYPATLSPEEVERRAVKQKKIEEVALARKKALEEQLAAWQQYPSWSDEPPDLTFRPIEGAFIDLDCHFTVGLPPDAVYDIICDPDNRRVFKGIKEVYTRNVLEDTGDFQLVEVEQAAIWRFLWMSGTFDITVKVAQDRPSYHVEFSLAKKGFMDRFEGHWDVKPRVVHKPAVSITEVTNQAIEGPEPDKEGAHAPSDAGPPILATDVYLKQIVNPAMVPPPPLANYVRGISAATTRKLVSDLQAEAQRIREGRVKGGLLLIPDPPKTSQERKDGDSAEGRKVHEGGGSGELRTLRRTRARRKML